MVEIITSRSSDEASRQQYGGSSDVEPKPNQTKLESCNFGDMSIRAAIKLLVSTAHKVPFHIADHLPYWLFLAFPLRLCAFLFFSFIRIRYVFLPLARPASRLFFFTRHVYTRTLRRQNNFYPYPCSLLVLVFHFSVMFCLPARAVRLVQTSQNWPEMMKGCNLNGIKS